MPMPSNPEAPWPPSSALVREYAEHDAWYSGDPARLAQFYGDAEDRDPSNRVSGGRFRFWSQQNTQPQRRMRLHLPLASDIATTSADLLFSDVPRIGGFTVDANGTYVEEMLDENSLWSRLIEGAEVSSALGGVYLRVVWDQETSDKPILTVVHPDAAVPSWRWGRLRDVVFWRVVWENDHGEVYRHLEMHEPGLVTHRLYKGTKTKIGQPVPLTETGDPDLAAVALTLQDGDVVPTVEGIQTAHYVPNMLPNRRFRGMPVGRSDYQTVEAVFDSIDETWTSLMRDLRLGRARLVVPSEYLRDNGPGRGSYFDIDQEVYEPLSMHPSKDGDSGIEQVQFDIRVEEHLQMAAALVKHAVTTSGYSGRSFGLSEDGSDTTATEVHAAERRSFVTRAKKAEYWKPALAATIEAMLAIGTEKLGATGLTPERPTIELPDGIQEDEKKKAETVELLERAKAASVKVRVGMLHPEWDEKAIEEEAAAILREDGVLIDPMQAGTLP